MNRRSRFSYQCRACGRCCHDKVITLSPYDVISIARAAEISTGDAVRRYTMRRGSILKFTPVGGCAALDGARCSIHPGRPLACRLYPLGLERGGPRGERFVRLEAAPGSSGIYGDAGAVEDFLSAQGVGPALEIIECYRRLLPTMRRRIDALSDFERTEPQEFWRRATREALAETNYDPNPLIDALFDPDGRDGHIIAAAAETVASHIRALERLVMEEHDPDRLAAAAVLLAVSLGYTPAEAITAGTRRVSQAGQA